MRVEPYTVGSYVHVVKRSARGVDLVNDEGDKWRFLRSLYYLNDAFIDFHWSGVGVGTDLFHRPDAWPQRKPLVDILGYTLMPNHFHLLLREITAGGLSLFMKKLGQSMTNHANEKYDEQGSIFQGAFRSKTIDTDSYLRYVAAYVMVKNTFELYPYGGLEEGQKDFDIAWEWAVTYPFSSIGDYAGTRQHSPILEKGLLGEIFNPEAFRRDARDMILGGKWKKQEKELEK